jgi:hypothetical protein
MAQTKFLITGATGGDAARQLLEKDHAEYSPIGLTSDRSNCRSLALRRCLGTSSISTLCEPH